MSQNIRKASGVGVRRTFIFELDEDGKALPESSSANPYEGEEVEGIKTVTIAEGALRRIRHTGEDVVIAPDTLPTQEEDTLNMTTGKSNLTLDAILSQTKVRDYGTLRVRVGGGSIRGDEAYVMTLSYQQAVDTDKTSPTYGRLRQWRGYLVPISQIAEQPQGMSENPVDKIYEGIIPPFFETPWLEVLDETDWGVEQGNYLELLVDSQPFINTYRGDSSRTTFNLSKSPKSDEHLHVWVEDTGLVTPTVIVTGDDPTFTLTAAPGDDLQVLAFIQTDRPNQRILPGVPSLTSPADLATVADLTPDLVWGAVSRADSYDIQIATSAAFTTILQDVIAHLTTTYTATTLVDGTTYHWRVRANNQHGESAWSASRSFTVDVP